MNTSTQPPTRSSSFKLVSNAGTRYTLRRTSGPQPDTDGWEITSSTPTTPALLIKISHIRFRCFLDLDGVFYVFEPFTRLLDDDVPREVIAQAATIIDPDNIYAVAGSEHFMILDFFAAVTELVSATRQQDAAAPARSSSKLAFELYHQAFARRLRAQRHLRQLGLSSTEMELAVALYNDIQHPRRLLQTVRSIEGA